MNTDKFYQWACRRVARNPQLNKHKDTIFYDWPNWNEHIEWIATGPVSSIIAWAEAVESYREEKEDV